MNIMSLSKSKPNMLININKEKSLNRIAPYCWILPSIILIFGVIFLPVVELFTTSFSKISKAGIRKGWNGIDNFKTLFSDPAFIMVLQNTLIWTVAIVGISTIISTGIALLIDKEFLGRRVVRAVLIFPWATSLIITASMWKWVFDYDYGDINLILDRIFGIKAIYWLADPRTSFPVLIFVGIFVTIPFTTFVILSGLQSISVTLYESANIDGANAFNKFFRITLPLLKESYTVCIVLNVIYVFNSFPIIWTITKGDPLNKTDTVVTYLYKLAFQINDMGPAAAASVVSFVILLLFSIAYVRGVMKGESVL